MNMRLIRFAVVLIPTGLLLTGCEEVLPIVAGVVSGTAARTSGASNEDAREWSIGVATAVRIVAKHVATERQRQVAEKHAQLAYKNMTNQQRILAKKIRDIAVKTERDDNSKGSISVMLYNTQTKQVVGNNVYDLEQTPKQGATIKLENQPCMFRDDGPSSKSTIIEEH